MNDRTAVKKKRISYAESIEYGCSEIGRLRTVVVHTPKESLNLINSNNCSRYLFDEVPDIDRFIEEHLKYRELLEDNGVEVLELSDLVVESKHKMNRMPNLTYMHDIAVVSDHGAMVSRMTRPGRKDEEKIVKEALQNLNIPVIIDFEENKEYFEGCLILFPDTVFVANTERHTKKAVYKFINKALNYFDNIIYAEIPQARRYMHPDTILNRIKKDLFLAYLPVLKETYIFNKNERKKINFVEYLKSRGIEILGVSSKEQKRLACSFVPLDSGVVLHYDNALNKKTIKKLGKKGVEFVFFHPSALLAGGGSLRCLTLRVNREK